MSLLSRLTSYFSPAVNRFEFAMRAGRSQSLSRNGYSTVFVKHLGPNRFNQQRRPASRIMTSENQPLFAGANVDLFCHSGLRQRWSGKWSRLGVGASGRGAPIRRQAKTASRRMSLLSKLFTARNATLHRRHGDGTTHYWLPLGHRFLPPSRPPAALP
jgi:hypothetical protein